MTKILDLYKRTTCWFDCIGMSLLVLVMRLWMANIFWKSGTVKYDDYETALMLFENEYAVPLIPFEWATFLATATELTAPILLLIGFATRLAAIPMLIMTLVIQFTYLDLELHYFWMMLLATLICYGPGKFSLDFFISRKLKGK